MTTTYYSVTTDAFSTFLNDFIISGSTTLDLTGWSVKLGTGNLQPTHETTDLINVIYDKDTTGYLGFTASVYASGGQLISIPIPNSVLEGNIITEIGLYDSNDVLMCAAATYLDLTRTSAQGLQPNFIEQLVLKDIPSGVTVVYETWDDYQLCSEKNQANGYAGLDVNAKLPIIHIPSGVELSANKGQQNGYCPLNENAKVPLLNIPELNYCPLDENLLVPVEKLPNLDFANKDLSNLSTTGEAHFVKPNIAVTHTANTAVGTSTRPTYVNSSGVATACSGLDNNIYATNYSSVTSTKPSMVIKEAVSGSSGYIIFSTGFCIQWGIYTNTNTSTTTAKYATINFSKTFKDTNYIFLRTSDFDSVNADKSYAYTGAYTTTDKSTASIKVVDCYKSYAPRSNWLAMGYLASGQY